LPLRRWRRFRQLVELLRAAVHNLVCRDGASKNSRPQLHIFEALQLSYHFRHQLSILFVFLVLELIVDYLLDSLRHVCGSRAQVLAAFCESLCNRICGLLAHASALRRLRLVSSGGTAEAEGGRRRHGQSI
jgi:hypothetical protein